MGRRRAGLVFSVWMVLLVFLAMPGLIFDIPLGRATSDSWVWVRDTVTGTYGEAVVGTGEDIYIARGTSFYLYRPADGSFGTIAPPPSPDGAALKTGTALAWDSGDYIYVLFGAATGDSRRWFYRYSISGNSWQSLANTPYDQGEANAMAWAGVDNRIYATIGGEQRPTYFLRYDPATNTWSDTTVADPPAGMGDGASIIWTGSNYVYALRGEFYESTALYDFWRYDLTTDTWTNMADIPADPHDGGVGGVGDGGSLLYIGLWFSNQTNYIYALSGNQAYPESPSPTPDNRFYRYTISTDSWERLADFPFGVGYYIGNRLGYARGHIYAWQGTPSTWAGGGDDLAKYEFAPASVSLGNGNFETGILNPWRPYYWNGSTLDFNMSHAVAPSKVEVQALIAYEGSYASNISYAYDFNYYPTPGLLYGKGIGMLQELSTEIQTSQANISFWVSIANGTSGHAFGGAIDFFYSSYNRIPGPTETTGWIHPTSPFFFIHIEEPGQVGVYEGSWQWLPGFISDYYGQWFHIRMGIPISTTAIGIRTWGNETFVGSLYVDKIQVEIPGVSPLDITPPVTTISLNGVLGNNDWFTSDVIVTISATDDTEVDKTEYAFDIANWITYTTPFSITREGNTIVYYKSNDKSGNSETTKTRTIRIDKIAPTGSIIIAGDVAYTNSSSIALTLSVTDATSGVAQMRFSNNGTEWSNWESHSTSKAWTLSTGDETKTVYVQFKDNAGQISQSYQDNITLDTTKPTANAGPDQTANVGITVTFDASSSSDNVGIVTYEWNFGDGGTETGKTTTHTYANTGTYTATLTVKDAAGNTATHSLIITVHLEGTPPPQGEAFPMWIVGAAVAAIALAALAILFLIKRK